MGTKYLSIMLQDCYKRPFFWNGFSCRFRAVLVPEPHSQTFHQLRQGVTPYHLGNKVANETRCYQNETSCYGSSRCLSKFGVKGWCFQSSWCLDFVGKCSCVTIFMTTRTARSAVAESQILAWKAGERICQTWKCHNMCLVYFTILKVFILKNKMKFDFMISGPSLSLPL